jgi:hypothetical protein
MRRRRKLRSPFGSTGALFHRQEYDMSYPFSRIAAALALGSLATSAAAQTVVDHPASFALRSAPAPVPASTALKAAYRVRLTSTWPQETTAVDCRNGGEEMLAGTLTRNADGTYAGTFDRNTELLFCGAHGTHGATSASCALTLEGHGTVAVTGVVMGDEASPSGRAMRVTWTPAPGQEVAVSGACAHAFKDAVKAMYLSTPHAAEFALTSVGAGPRTERLEDYAWSVELE